MLGGWSIAATGAIKVTCAEIGIGNCSAKTPTLSAGFANIANVLILLIGMLAVVFVIVGGLQIASSAGDPKRYKQGRDTLQYALVGVVLAIAAYAIVNGIALALGK
jgi:hypothetical protein